MSVNLRIEGPDWTLYEEEVKPSGHPVTAASDSVARQCDGCGRGTPCTAGNTFTSTLDDVVSTWDGTYSEEYKDYLITSIEGIRATAPSYWQLYINGIPAEKGGCQSTVKPNDSLLAAFGNSPLFEFSLLYARVDRNRVNPGDPVVVSVWIRTALGDAPMNGATVGGKETGLYGKVTLRFPYPAVKKLKATKDGFIRSATVTVTIGNLPQAEE